MTNIQKLIAAETVAEQALSAARKKLRDADFSQAAYDNYYAAKDALLKIRDRLEAGEGYANTAAARQLSQLALDDA